LTIGTTPRVGKHSLHLKATSAPLRRGLSFSDLEARGDRSLAIRRHIASPAFACRRLILFGTLFFPARFKPRKSDHKRRPGASVTAADMTRNSTDRQQAAGLKKECTQGAAITQIGELHMPTQSRGRPVKFTPERIQQIKNLVERSKSREEIAELIGVTVDSLQVTCSRLGVSLRRPTFNSGLVSLRRNEPRLDQVHTPRSGHGSDMHLIKGRPERNAQTQPDEAERPRAVWKAGE
jgi:hypothetical protein